MSHSKSKWGGKLAGNHSTVIEAAWRFLPDVIREESVIKISPGFISSHKGLAGRRSLKIISEHGSILLSVSGSGIHQEIRVFSSDYAKSKLVIERAAEKADFQVSFMDHSH